MKNTFKIAALAALASSGFANAASYSEYGTFTDSDNSLTLNTTTTAIAGFNSSLGTLTGIVVEFSSMTVGATTTLENIGGTPSTINTAKIGYTGTGGSILPYLTGVGVASLTFPSVGTAEVTLTGTSPIAPGGTQTWSGSNTLNNPILATTQSIASGFFANYTGGTVTFTVTGEGATTISSTGGSPQFVSPALTGSGDVKITYTYDAIPEPGAALLGSLGLLALLRRRR
jgi:hypothetical protein